MRRFVRLAVFATTLAGAACGVRLSGDVGPETGADAATEASEAMPAPVDGSLDVMADDGAPDAPDAQPDAGCPPGSTPGCACVKCASGSCSNGKCDPAVFVTSATRPPDFATNAGVTGDVAADALCNQAAVGIARSPTTSFVAWLSTKASPVAKRIQPSLRPYRLLDAKHTVVAMTFDALSVPLSHPIDVTESGETLGTGNFAWTGSDRSGHVHLDDTCVDWTSGASMNGVTGGVGDVKTIDATWSLASSAPCAAQSMFHFYCFEQAQ